MNARKASSEGLRTEDGGISPACTRRRIFSQSARCSITELFPDNIATFRPPEAVRSLWHCSQVPVRSGETVRANSSGACPFIEKGIEIRKDAASNAAASFNPFTRFLLGH